MKLIATQAFKFAHRGVKVEEFEKGQKFETEDQALIDVVLQEKWAKKLSAKEDSAQPDPAVDPDAPSAL